MNRLTKAGETLVKALQDKHGIEADTAIAMMEAARAGNGTMAQFSTRELGYGQWMQGGMTMVSDMFNHTLKAKVDRICSDVAAALRDGEQLMEQTPTARGGGGAGSASWWPSSLGVPSSSGSQNEMSYAVFPGSKRLAVRIGTDVGIFDTEDHVITGIGQQQGGTQMLDFTSQKGSVPLHQLRRVKE